MASTSYGRLKLRGRNGQKGRIILGGIRHSENGPLKNFFLQKKKSWLFIGVKLPNEEKSSSALCLILTRKGPFLQKTANFGQIWSKLPIFGAKNNF